MDIDRYKAFFLYGYISQTFKQHREHEIKHCSLTNKDKYCDACKGFLATLESYPDDSNNTVSL